MFKDSLFAILERNHAHYFLEWNRPHPLEKETQIPTPPCAKACGNSANQWQNFQDLEDKSDHRKGTRHCCPPVTPTPYHSILSTTFLELLSELKMLLSQVTCCINHIYKQESCKNIISVSTIKMNQDGKTKKLPCTAIVIQKKNKTLRQGNGL